MDNLLEQIHPQLVQDCHLILQLPDLIVLLHRNALIPWFILVPVSSEGQFRELFEIPREHRNEMMSVSNQLSEYLMRRFGCSKLNVAAIGNLVPQFHWHVIGRSETDPLWPKPVWGNLGENFKAWQEEDVQTIRTEVERLLETLSGTE